MKIRIKDDSLRLRLTQSEVKNFESERRVSCAIHFPAGDKLTYTLIWGSGDEFDATYDGLEIKVTVPYSVGMNWLNPEQVGMEDHVPLSQGGQLRLLIEKDFACLSERKDEDESDMFPNPNDHC